MEELSSQIWFCQLPGLRRIVAVANILQGAVYTCFAPAVEWCLQRCLQGGDAFGDLACHNGGSENTTLRGNEPRVTWDKPRLQQCFGLRLGNCLPAFALPSMNTVFRIFFQSYKNSCCFKFFSLLYYFTVPVCGEFTTAKSSSYKNATIWDGDFSVNSNQINWTYCSMQYWKPAIHNFLKELRITAKKIRNCFE